MKTRKLLKKLNYLPRWAWYMISFFTFGPFGILGVYLAFHVLGRMAQEEAEDEYEERFSVFRSADTAERVYQDEECVVGSEADVQQRWAQTEQSARQARAPQQQTREKAATIAEDADVADVMREGRNAMNKIRRANDIIADEALSAQIDSIENSCGQILTILEQRPQLLSQLRTFLRYYLPTTLHLLDARAKLENTANTPKARQVRQQISDALGVIDKAFLKQVEALDEYRFIDLESEIDVLRDMLKADGLLMDEEAEDDPFAQVLETRASAHRSGNKNIPMAGH